MSVDVFAMRRKQLAIAVSALTAIDDSYGAVVRVECAGRDIDLGAIIDGLGKLDRDFERGLENAARDERVLA